MEYRRLGASGLRVSPVCLGALQFGERTDEAEAKRIAASARDSGVNFIDTADTYGPSGASERMVGRLLAKDRDDWVLATKVGMRFDGDPQRSGHSRRWIHAALDASLTRLGTDYVDLYYLHWHDPATPLEETIGTLADLIRLGKVRYWGFSNYRGWHIAEMMRICEATGAPKPIAAQPSYSILARQAEQEYIPACAHFGIGVLPYSPLARGVLTGKYRKNAALPKGSRAADPGYQKTLAYKLFKDTDLRPENLGLVAKIVARAKARKMTPTDFAIAWVMANRHVTSLVAGPRTLAQWTVYVKALKTRISPADEAFIDKLVAPGYNATHGYLDPRLALEGRVPRTKTAV